MMGFGPGIMGGGFSIIFWIVIIGVIYYFFREYNRKNHQRHDDKREIDHRIDDDNPEELARQRYAKGEISKEELKEILDNLDS